MATTVNIFQGEDFQFTAVFNENIDDMSNVYFWITDKTDTVVTVGTTALKFSLKTASGHITGCITKTAAKTVQILFKDDYTAQMERGVYKCEIKYAMTTSTLKKACQPLLLNIQPAATKAI